LLVMIWANLNRMRARVTLTAIGVVIGTAAVLVLISLGAGLQRSTAQQFGELGDLTRVTVLPASFFRAFASVGMPSTSQESGVLDDEAIAEIKKMEHVVAVTPELQLMANYTISLNRAPGFATVTGIDPEVVGQLGWKLASGSPRLGANQVVVGAKVGEGFVDPQRQRQLEPVNLQGRSLSLSLVKFTTEGQQLTRQVRLRVGGVLAESGTQDDVSIFLPLSEVVKLNDWAAGQRTDPGRKGYPQVLVKVDASQNVLAVSNQLELKGYVPISLQATLQGLNVIFSIMQAILGGIGAIALLVAAFGIANTMTMAIYERTREIGIMKALGATNRDVMQVFLGEAGAIGLLGGVVGVLLGMGLSKGIDIFVVYYLGAQQAAAGGEPPQSILFTPAWLVVFDVVFATVVGVLSGVYPAVRAASMKPLMALRYE